MDRPGIYVIQNITNGHVYIGSAVSIRRRFWEHTSSLRLGNHDNQHLQRAWNKYGEGAFSFNIERLCAATELIMHEQRCIDTYKEKLGWDSMYNMNVRAESRIGMSLSPETRAKVGRPQDGEKNGFYGKSHTPESIEKMRQAKLGITPWNKGTPWSDEMKAKISAARMGQPGWSKGLTKDTDDRLKALSETLSGKYPWQGKEHPRGMLGKTHTEESKRKIGDAQRGVPKTVEANKKNSESHLGIEFTEEHKRNISIAQKKLNRPRDANGHFLSRDDIVKLKTMESA